MRLPSSRRRIMLWIALLLLAPALLFVVLNLVVWTKGRARMHESIDELAIAPVAIVLGAAVKLDGTPSDALADRLAQAVELHRAGKVQKLLLTGDHGGAQYDETNCMRRYVLDNGVPPEDVFCDHAGFSTYDSIARARDVFGVTRAIVVTQRFHLPRALYTGLAMGLDVEGVPCDQRTYVKGLWFELRECGSRVKAEVQAGWLEPPPRVLGPKIALDGDGRASWDTHD